MLQIVYMLEPIKSYYYPEQIVDARRSMSGALTLTHLVDVDTS